VDGLFGLMLDYSIPLSGEDSGMLSTIKTSLDSLSSSTETKKANKSVLLGKFQEELSSEVAALKENILGITQVPPLPYLEFLPSPPCRRLTARPCWTQSPPTRR
jgi:hypothetical protein